jgi:predicted P-loop ATPase
MSNIADNSHNCNNEFDPAILKALRGTLYKYGYRAVALRTGEKFPVTDKWQIGARLDPPEAVTATPHPDLQNTDILCDGLRVVDTDIDDPGRAEAVLRLARTMLGAAPIRTREGSSRLTLLYRAAEGEPSKRDVSNKAAGEKVEVLGRGQQFMCHGVHPSGKPVEWQGMIPRADLAAVTDEQIGAFLDAAAKVIGATDASGGDGWSGDYFPPPETLEAADRLLLERIVAALPNDGKFDGRISWIALAHALAAAYVRDPWRGRYLFVEHASRWHGTVKDDEAGRVYDSIGTEHKVGADHIIQWATDAGVDQRLIDAYRDDERHRAQRAAQEAFKDDAQERPAEKVFVRYARSADWQGMLQKTPKKQILGNLHNVIIALRHAPEFDGVFRFNTFGQTVQVAKSPPWYEPWKTFEPHELLNVEYSYARKWLQGQDIQASKGDVESAVIAVAHDDQFHPVRDYIGGLQWDGVARLDTWLIDHVGADDTDYTRAVGARFLIGAVARVMRPGCKLDQMMILEGPQNLGKSKVFKVLGEPWFTDCMPDVGSKDAMIQLQGVWIIEQAEMHNMTRADVSRMTSFMTTTHDRFRAPYDRHPEKHARQCIFAGSINPNGNGYLKDETGRRRYQSVECAVGWKKGRPIDIDRFTEAKDQLWAEARVRFERGEAWWLDTFELTEAAEVVADTRYDADVWTDAVLAWAETKASATNAEVLELALGLKKIELTKANEMRVGGILRQAKWERKQGGDRKMRYWNPKPPAEPEQVGPEEQGKPTGAEGNVVSLPTKRRATGNSSHFDGFGE